MLILARNKLEEVFERQRVRQIRDDLIKEGKLVIVQQKRQEDLMTEAQKKKEAFKKKMEAKKRREKRAKLRALLKK